MSTAYQSVSASQRVADFIGKERPMLIGSAWVPAVSGATQEIINPATGEVVARVAQGGSQDLDHAVQAARTAFASGVWQNLGADARARILWRMAELIEAHADELAELECLCSGILFRDAKAKDVAQAARCFRYFAGYTDKIYGRANQFTAGPANFHAYTVHEPVGVAGLIIPFNAPIMITAWKLAPALAAGCTCVVKPATETPLTALRMGELLQEAGVPAGVVNIVLSGTGVGAALAAHPDVDKVSFTGSTEVGKDIVHAATGNMKRLVLELGGKSPFIVFDDADLEQAIAGSAVAIFANAGQICSAGSRLYVQKKSYERVVAGIAAIGEKMRLGNGMDPGTDMGPLISAKQQRRVLDLIQSGLSQGAELVTGGKRFGEQGFFVTPTVFGQTRNSMRIVREEIFGPVLAAAPFEDAEQVIREANDTRYGLVASIWTRDIPRAQALVRKLNAGRVCINCHGRFDYSMPSGGFKESGWGREHAEEGLKQYLEAKSVFSVVG